MSDPPTKIMALWIIMPLFRPFDIAAERYHLIKMRILRNEQQPLNNKYSIYYLLYEYLTYTKFYIYWLIIARVFFEKLVLLKIRVIIKLFPFEG